MTKRTIFSARHSANTIIDVIFQPATQSKRSELIVVVAQFKSANGGVLQRPRITRFYDPGSVTIWFMENSRANADAWRTAYHTSGLQAKDFGAVMPVGDVLLKVPYLSQRDNVRFPGGSCNVTSYAMVMAYHGIKPRGQKYRQFEDELEHFLQSKGRDRHFHEDLAWMADQYGLDARFNVNRSWADIRAELRAGRPVIVSGVYTSSGHIIVIIGLKGNDFIVHDPWGNALLGYKGARGRQGRQLVYPFPFMQAKTRYPAATTKWAHFLKKRN